MNATLDLQAAPQTLEELLYGEAEDLDEHVALLEVLAIDIKSRLPPSAESLVAEDWDALVGVVLALRMDVTALRCRAKEAGERLRSESRLRAAAGVIELDEVRARRTFGGP